MAPRAKPPTGATNSKITPLWIVAAFVTLTEAVLGVALTQVTGGVQIALTTFVIVFAFLVAGAFFAILWSRPYVFYSPAEFGDTDPKGFIDAMRGRIPDQFAHKASEAEAKPQDHAAQFSLIESLMKDTDRQHVILMHTKDVSLPISDYYSPRFETGNYSGSWSTGGISGREISQNLGGSGLVAIDPQGLQVKLTTLGSEFAQWLIATDKKNDYYQSDLGGWGTLKRPEGIPQQFFEEAFLGPTQVSARRGPVEQKETEPPAQPQ